MLIDLLDCYSRLLVKDWTAQDSSAVKQDLALAMATLEYSLPCYWNTQTRHMPLCRFIPQLDNYGSFWAICMLAIESYHQHVGRCGRSKKNMMKSFANNYEVFDMKQTMWSADEEGKNDSTAGHGSRYFKEPGSIESRTVSLGKRQAVHPVQLSQSDYLKVVRLYHQVLELENSQQVLQGLLNRYLLEVEPQSSRFYYLQDWEPKATLSRAAMDLLKTIRTSATTQVCLVQVLYPFSSLFLYSVSSLLLYLVIIVLHFVPYIVLPFVP